MVLRMNGSESTLPNSSRNNEVRIWRAASDEGIAPPLLHVDEMNQFLVSSYIKNDLPVKPQNDIRLVNQALELLKQCHQLNVSTQKIDYSRHIEYYWEIIEAKEGPISPALIKQREPMRRLLEKLDNSNHPTGICHHDPVKENFVGSLDRLYLIDWEYAAYGLPVMDYAALSVEWGIEDSVVVEQTGIDPDSLSLGKALYRYLCQLWEAITPSGA